MAVYISVEIHQRHWCTTTNTGCELMMRLTVVLLCLAGAGCTTCPQAGFLDRVRPSRNACPGCSSSSHTVAAPGLSVNPQIASQAHDRVIVLEPNASVAADDSRFGRRGRLRAAHTSELTAQQVAMD